MPFTTTLAEVEAAAQARRDAELAAALAWNRYLDAPEDSPQTAELYRARQAAGWAETVACQIYDATLADYPGSYTYICLTRRDVERALTENGLAHLI